MPAHRGPSPVGGTRGEVSQAPARKGRAFRTGSLAAGLQPGLRELQGVLSCTKEKESGEDIAAERRVSPKLGAKKQLSPMDSQ